MLSIPVQVINTLSAFCLTGSRSRSYLGSVFRYRPHRPVTNTHTSEKSALDEEANSFWVQEGNRGCAEVTSVDLPPSCPSFGMHKHLNIYEGQVKTIFVHWRPVVSQWNGIMKKPISSFVRAM